MSITLHAYKIFFTLVFMLSANTSNAVDWQLLVDDPRTSLEFDADSLTKHDGLVEARFRFNHSDPQPSANGGHLFLTAEVQSMFDCTAKKYAPYSRDEFEGAKSTGAMVNRVVRNPVGIVFSDAVPNSMGDIMIGRACKSAALSK